MRKTSLLILAILLFMPLVSSVSINEIMYDPLGDDNNKEFVEVLGTDNLSGYNIGDLASNDSLLLLKFVPGNFSLIVEEGFNHSEINCSIYSAGATIGNNLNNEGDTIFLYYNKTLIDVVQYNNTLAHNNGYSLELVNGSWRESCTTGGSPGMLNCMIANVTNATATINDSNATTNSSTENQTENKTEPSLKLEIILQKTLFVGVVYDSLFRITNLNRTAGSENFVFAAIKYNVTRNNSLVMEDYFNKTINYYSESGTGSLFFEERGNYTLCGAIINSEVPVSACEEFEVINPLTIPCFIEINISSDKEIYEEGETIGIQNTLSNESYPFIIEYWAEDLFGSVLKDMINTSNTNTKSYTPKIDENDKVLLIKNKLVFVGCDNSNPVLESQKMVVVKRKEAIEASSTSTGSTNNNTASTSSSGSTDSSVIINETGKIFSFYTLTKLFKPEIKLYANIKGTGTYEMVLLSNKEEQQQTIIAPKKMNFSVEAEPGLNLYTLMLKKSNKTIETRALVVQLEEKNSSKAINKIVTNATKSKTSNLTSNKTSTSKNASAAKQSKQNNSGQLTLANSKKATSKANSSVALTNLPSSQSISDSLSPLTSDVVYESSNTKALKFAPYLLILLVAMAIAGLLISKRR